LKAQRIANQHFPIEAYFSNFIPPSANFTPVFTPEVSALPPRAKCDAAFAVGGRNIIEISKSVQIRSIRVIRVPINQNERQRIFKIRVNLPHPCHLCSYHPIFATQIKHTLQFTISPADLPVYQAVRDAAASLGIPAYVVGGHVRDRILGRPCKDLDFVCVGNGIALAEATAKNLGKNIKVSVYQRFGTAAFRYKDLELEFVGARKESYSPDSRKPDVLPGTLRDDQLRRDFTINALAVSLCPDDFGTLLDPFDGVGDLERKIIRTPVDPLQTFSDDPLRMLRAIRFATQLGFQIDEDTFRGIQESAERIHIISAERISTELDKIMRTPKPSVGYNMLAECGLLQIFMHEITDLAVVEDINGVGHKNNFTHSLEVLDNVCAQSDDIWLRWAALLHDIGKAPTKRFDPETKGWTFHAHEFVGAKMTVGLFKRLRMPLDDHLTYVRKLVSMHMRPIGLSKDEVTDSAVRRLIFDAGTDIEDLMTLCTADITTKNPRKMARHLEAYELLKLRISEVNQSDRLRLWQPPITGEIIMETFQLQPSPLVGVIKNAIREAILDGEIVAEYDAAFAFMLKKGAEMGLSPN
jgi:poly(A) polymerase